MLQFILILIVCASVPLALWLAYRLGRKICDMEWREAIEWSDDPEDSRWNSDHKSTWSMVYRGSTAPLHVHIPTFLLQFFDEADVVLARFVDTNYDYAVGTTRDQSLPADDRVECWNEFVLRRRRE